jgi:hypothetical protein
VKVDGRTTREIVIEVERIQLVRKRARTDLHYCDKCETVSDFVGLSDAARLFEIQCDRLFGFIQENKSHFMEGRHGEIQICLTSLLERMRAVNGNNRLGGSTGLNIGSSNDEIDS